MTTMITSGTCARWTEVFYAKAVPGLCAAALAVGIHGCQTPSVKPARIVVVDRPGANPWTDLQFRNDPDAFQFAIVTDRTGGLRAGVFPDGVRKADLLQPEFVMSVGDLIQGYTEDEAELDRQWDEFAGS